MQFFQNSCSPDLRRVEVYFFEFGVSWSLPRKGVKPHHKEILDLVYHWLSANLYAKLHPSTTKQIWNYDFFLFFVPAILGTKVLADYCYAVLCVYLFEINCGFAWDTILTYIKYSIAQISKNIIDQNFFIPTISGDQLTLVWGSTYPAIGVSWSFLEKIFKRLYSKSGQRYSKAPKKKFVKNFSKFHMTPSKWPCYW